MKATHYYKYTNAGRILELSAHASTAQPVCVVAEFTAALTTHTYRWTRSKLNWMCCRRYTAHTTASVELFTVQFNVCLLLRWTKLKLRFRFFDTKQQVWQNHLRTRHEGQVPHLLVII
jgi:hypothetical protein